MYELTDTIDQLREQLATERAAHAEELRQFRKMLWLGHGHTFMYGDDGEMQCAECLRFADRQSDYKRNDLLKLLAHVLKMHAEELRRVEQERDALRDLLREAQDQICECSECADLRSRIDAVLTPSEQAKGGAK